MTPDDPTERGTFGDRRILVDELNDSYQPLDDDGDVKAKVWEADADTDERRLYLRVRDHDDGRRYNEYSVSLGGQADE